MLIECLLIVNLFANYPIFVKNLGLEIHWKHLSAANALDQVQRINLEYAVQLQIIRILINEAEQLLLIIKSSGINIKKYSDLISFLHFKTASPVPNGEFW